MTLNRKRVKIIYHYLFGILAIIIGLIIGAKMFFPSIGNEIIKYQHFVVVSNSMEPKINVNDGIIVKPTPSMDLQVGDIITFKVDINKDGHDEYVTHYIAQIDKEEIRTKPNISDKWDTWVLHENQIVGKVIKVLPKVGVILIPLYNHAVPILLIALCLVLYTLYRVVISKEHSDH